MAMQKVKDLVVKLREYTDSSGQKKSQWASVGSLMRGDDGNEFILLDRHFSPAGIANPENRGNVLISMFEPKPRSGGDAGGYQKPPTDDGGSYGDQRQGSGGRNDLDDEIPF